jgi:hypothetical protein
MLSDAVSQSDVTLPLALPASLSRFATFGVDFAKKLGMQNPARVRNNDVTVVSRRQLGLRGDCPYAPA